MSAVGQSNPFSDASEYNSLSFIIARALDEMQTVSIVQVKAVDTVKLTVDAQVLVNLVTGANISVPHGVISARPYYRAQGGTSGIILDPVVGDIGVMVFAARDSSAVVAAKGLANPGSQRRFSWSDGMYFGGVLNSAPTQYLKFAGGGITLLSPTAINIQSPANKVTGPLEVTGVATFDTDVHILGSLFLTGVLHGSSAIFSGNVTAASFTGGGGGGGGTVTSVGISTPGAGAVVGGGPVTTAGTLTVDLSSTTYAALALAVTALQSISIATGTGLTGGPLAASGSTVALSAATIASLLPGSPVQGDIAYYNGAAWALLAPGTAGYVLQTGGAGANPSWVAAGGGAAFSGAAIYFAGTFSCATGTSTPMPFDTVDFDTGSYWSVSHPSRLTVPATGYYAVAGSVLFNSAANPGEAVATFWVNGVAKDYAASVLPLSSVASVTPSTATVLKLTAGDYVEFVIFQNSGANLSVIVVDQVTRFSISYQGS